MEFSASNAFLEQCRIHLRRLPVGPAGLVESWQRPRLQNEASASEAVRKIRDLVKAYVLSPAAKYGTQAARWVGDKATRLYIDHKIDKLHRQVGGAEYMNRQRALRSARRAGAEDHELLGVTAQHWSGISPAERQARLDQLTGIPAAKPGRTKSLARASDKKPTKPKFGPGIGEA